MNYFVSILAFHNSQSSSANKKPNPTMANIETIGLQAFQNAKLTRLDIPKVKTIGATAFLNSLLTTINLPKVETIGTGAFQGAHLTSLILPAVKTIGSIAFDQSKLTNISLPLTLTSVGKDAFNKIVNAATTTVTIPEILIDSKDKKNDIFGAGN